MCPSVEALAAVAAGEETELVAHVDSCVECASLVAQQREIRLLARQLPVPRLAPLRRAKLAITLTRELELNTPGVALALDLMDRIDALEARLRRT